MLFVHKTTYFACANIHQEALQVLARLANIHQPGLLGLPDSPTFANLVCSDSPDSLTFPKHHF
jgi:hypothetical protein